MIFCPLVMRSVGRWRAIPIDQTGLIWFSIETSNCSGELKSSHNSFSAGNWVFSVVNADFDMHQFFVYIYHEYSVVFLFTMQDNVTCIQQSSPYILKGIFYIHFCVKICPLSNRYINFIDHSP